MINVASAEVTAIAQDVEEFGWSEMINNIKAEGDISVASVKAAASTYILLLKDLNKDL